ncbi:MAG: hypothetical protein HY076_01680, partial [Candidatus Eisenbacteria bacterium]|nr:hypothetical protein [Candidatus Eisenbacteria bacterium]
MTLGVRVATAHGKCLTALRGPAHFSPPGYMMRPQSIPVTTPAFMGIGRADVADPQGRQRVGGVRLAARRPPGMTADDLLIARKEGVPATEEPFPIPSANRPQRETHMPRPLRPRSASNRRITRSVRARAGLPEPATHTDPRDGALIAPQPAALPVEVARQAQREMDRLRRLPSGTPEAAQVRS